MMKRNFFLMQLCCMFFTGLMGQDVVDEIKLKKPYRMASLRDSSKIMLNRHSSLLIKNGRVADYFSGEGYFNVHASCGNRFLLVGDGYEICTYTPAVFNVNAYGMRGPIISKPQSRTVCVKVISGDLQMYFGKTPYLLHVGNTYLVSSTGAHVIADLYGSQDREWFDGVYSFRTIKLKELKRLAKQLYKVRLDYDAALAGTVVKDFSFDPKNAFSEGLKKELQNLNLFTVHRLSGRHFRLMPKNGEFTADNLFNKTKICK